MDSGKKIVYDPSTRKTTVVKDKEFEANIPKTDKEPEPITAEEQPEEAPSSVEPVKVKGKRKSKVAKEGKAHVEADKPTFPAKGTVNAYGFIHLSNGVAEAFGAPRGQKTTVTIDFEEGKLIISKA